MERDRSKIKTLAMIAGSHSREPDRLADALSHTDRTPGEDVACIESLESWVARFHPQPRCRTHVMSARGPASRQEAGEASRRPVVLSPTQPVTKKEASWNMICR